MAERPIIFSAPMVRALLAGRKSQTRRLIVPRRKHSLFDGKWADSYVLDPGNASWRQDDVRYQRGDRLWVREPLKRNPHMWVYEADGSDVGWPGRSDLACRQRDHSPAMHMPRSVSRFTLLVTDVRVQRLQDIAEWDAAAEGPPCHVCGGQFPGESDCHCFHRKPARVDFEALWNSLNAKRAPWDSNPWVVALSFELQRGNIDAANREAE